MDKIRKSYITATVVAVVTMGIGSGSALAGGFLDIEFEDATFLINPLMINNPYWPLRPDDVSTPRTFTYIGETEDECVIDQISVNDIDHDWTYPLTGAAPYFGKTAVQVVDTEWVFEDVEVCDLSLLPEDSAIKEFTLDWYMQDDQQNIWYVGEKSQNFEEFDCGEYPDVRDPGTHPQCFEGSWEAGKPSGEGDEEVIGAAGIVVPSDLPFGLDGEPLSNGTYYLQEVAYEAEDMAKILRQDASLSVEDGYGDGEYEFCRKVKEWNPYEPGESVEHKWYCTDGPGGLVLIEGVGGGRTEVETLVEVGP